MWGGAGRGGLAATRQETLNPEEGEQVGPVQRGGVAGAAGQQEKEEGGERGHDRWGSQYSAATQNYRVRGVGNMVLPYD